MNTTEQRAFQQLQEVVSKVGSETQLAGWTVKTGKKGLYYWHEPSALACQTLGATRVAMLALARVVRVASQAQPVLLQRMMRMKREMRCSAFAHVWMG